MAADSRVQVHLECPDNPQFPRKSEPVRLGVPFVPGSMPGPAFVVRSADGQAQPTQFRILERWPDGSPRWLLVDFLADIEAGETAAVYTLESTREDGVPRPASAMAIEASESGVTVDTAVARFDMRRGGDFPFAAILAPGNAVTPRATFAVDAGGVSKTAITSTVIVEDSGPLRVVIRTEARVDLPGIDGLELVAWLHFFCGSPVVRLEVTLRNPHAAQHPGGIWELGEPAAMLLRDVSFTLTPAATGATVRCSLDSGKPQEPSGESLELFQASSGGPHWNARTHLNRHGRVPLAFRGYRLRDARGETTGERATPVVMLGADGAALALTMPQFWQQFPKAIEASGDGLTLRLFPRQHGEEHELQPGEQKTHVFFVAVGDDPISSIPLAWARSPLLARTTPQQYAAAAAMPYLLPLADEPHPGYSALVALALEGPDSFERKRETIDEYGWRSYGDLYADHESAYYRGPVPIVSHYNNQYDAIAGLACQFMRSGDSRWWQQMDDLAAHVVDIDIYHTDADKAGYNRGLFWHTSHYVDAGKATHRSFPRDPDVHGGGPSPEHNYATGLLLHYFLTGTERSRETAIGLARWVVAMDDGGRTPGRWLSRGDTGWASATNSLYFQGPGRGAGHSIAALLDGYRLTGDRPLLEKAEQLIQRCIHPDDDISKHELLDIERRWSYTIFLHVLGRYLDGKNLRGELDAGFAHARQALLVYARWMAAHESPYHHRREQLEYPTETWMAQELWKSEVFLFAARYGRDDERERFIERASYFFDYAIGALGESPTRAMTRPLVLLLSRGVMHGYVRRHPEVLTSVPAPEPFRSAGPPRRFVPQKALVIRRLKALAVAGVLTAILGVAALLL